MRKYIDTKRQEFIYQIRIDISCFSLITKLLPTVTTWFVIFNSNLKYYRYLSNYNKTSIIRNNLVCYHDAGKNQTRRTSF